MAAKPTARPRLHDRQLDAKALQYRHAGQSRLARGARGLKVIVPTLRSWRSDQQANQKEHYARGRGGAACAQEPAAAGDDRDRGEDDADLEAHLSELVVDVLGIGVVGFVLAGFDLAVEVGVGRAQLLDYAGLVPPGLNGGLALLGTPGREGAEQNRVALGDVDLYPVALQPGGGVGAMGLAGDDLLHRLIGEKHRDGEEGRHQADDHRRVSPVVRTDMTRFARGYLMPLLEALI